MPTWLWWGLILGLCTLCWLWGRRSRPQAPAGTGPLEDNSWAVYFSPHDGALEAIRKSIRGAKRTILVQAYLFKSKQLAGALVRAHQRGVQVILDAEAKPHRPPVDAVAFLLAAKIPVFLDDQHVLETVERCPCAFLKTWPQSRQRNRR
jgi:phosphatidylserine/phosphatidylglycerophosphate/cardiolipin synthase-like enzyme